MESTGASASRSQEEEEASGEGVVGMHIPAVANPLRSVAGPLSVVGSPFRSTQERHSARTDIRGSPPRAVERRSLLSLQTPLDW